MKKKRVERNTTDPDRWTSQKLGAKQSRPQPRIMGITPTTADDKTLPWGEGVIWFNKNEKQMRNRHKVIRQKQGKIKKQNRPTESGRRGKPGNRLPEKPTTVTRLSVLQKKL